ncbi:MAG: hypothetical protein HY920_02990 [Elusimicrobia bacterium]|nr:hypothetical protein [Elusimicrobiota bacterium]
MSTPADRFCNYLSMYEKFLNEHAKNTPSFSRQAWIPIIEDAISRLEAGVQAENKQDESQGEMVPALNIKGRTTVNFTKTDDGWHWFVNGEDKGAIAENEEKIIYKISCIIFDNLDCPVITHNTFLKKLDWNNDEYYGNKDEGKKSRMQRQISELRRKTGIDFKYDRKEGIIIPKNLVKSR